MSKCEICDKRKTCDVPLGKCLAYKEDCNGSGIKSETDDIMDFVEPKDYLVESKSVQRRETVQKKKTIAILDDLIDKTTSGAFDDKFEEENIREAMNNVHGYNTFAFNQHSWIGKDPVEFRQFLYALVKSGYKSRQQETESRSVQRREAVQNERIAGEFIQAYGSFDGRLNYRKDIDEFVLQSASMPPEAADRYNNKYMIYKLGRKSAIKQSQQEREELQEALNGAHLQIDNLRNKLT